MNEQLFHGSFDKNVFVSAAFRRVFLRPKTHLKKKKTLPDPPLIYIL